MCDKVWQGEGESKLAKNSVTYFMDGPFVANLATQLTKWLSNHYDNHKIEWKLNFNREQSQRNVSCLPMSLMEFNNFLKDFLCLIWNNGNSLQVVDARVMLILIIVTNLWLDSIRSKQRLRDKRAWQPIKKNKHIICHLPPLRWFHKVWSYKRTKDLMRTENSYNINCSLLHRLNITVAKLYGSVVIQTKIIKLIL